MEGAYVKFSSCDKQAKKILRDDVRCEYYSLVELLLQAIAPSGMSPFYAEHQYIYLDLHLSTSKNFPSFCVARSIV
jgi:hypothetical protein